VELFAQRCPWYVVGPLIGLVVIGLRWTANKHFGALGGYVDLRSFAAQPSSGLSWRVLFFIGMALGGGLSALAAGGAAPGLGYPTLDVLGASLPVKAAVLLGAGFLMGLGATTAGGCTSGHGVCGTSQGSPASLAATATFMGTAVLVTNAAAALFGRLP
jgi:uncharacterized membrane protein YedE/YeeE